MIDDERWRICETIAIDYPYSVQEVYDIYVDILDNYNSDDPLSLLRKTLNLAVQMGCESRYVFAPSLRKLQ